MYHGPVVEVAHGLARLLSASQELDAEGFARDDIWLHGVGEVVDVQDVDAMDLGDASQPDYISTYRRVIDHFDAVKIGLTATPALHTTEILGPPVYQ